MNNQEFRDKVYEKYEYYKDKTNDEFFYKKSLKKSSKILRMVAGICTITILTGAIGIAANIGGTEIMPILNWLGINIPKEEYQKYKVQVENIGVAAEETSINLASTMCVDGFTVLEFDVHLSQEDKECLRIGEKLYSDEEIEEQKKYEYEYLRENLEKSREYMTEEEIATVLDIIENGPWNWESSKDLIYTVELIFNEKSINEIVGVDNEKQSRYLSNNFSVIVDGERHFLRGRSDQKTVKVSEYEYKIYQMFLFTEEELQGKENFNITLNDLVLQSETDPNSVKKLTRAGNYSLYNSNDKGVIYIADTLNIPISSNNVSESIVFEKQEIKYNTLTEEIEKVRVTPLQTIVEIKNTFTNASLESLTGIEKENYISNIFYKVYDGNGNEIPSSTYEIKRQITYSDGRVEEWGVGDIRTYLDFNDAILEIVEYIVIENKEDIKSLRIVPIIEVKEKNEFVKKEIGEFNINLK